MRTEINPLLQNRTLVQEADSILRKCVHCGFCTATCPTYQLTGDELDGPRGRIYLIKNMLEDNAITAGCALHLDRCLTCRSCETTCPSGVEYGRLLDIARGLRLEVSAPPYWRRLLSAMIRLVIPRPRLLRPLLRLGRLFRPILPSFIRMHVPPAMPVAHKVDTGVKGRVLLLGGCIQSAATPNVVASLQAVLKKQGVQAESLSEGCCGALDYHLGAHDAGRRRMMQVVDQLHPRLAEVDAIVSSATGCGVTVKEYPEILKDDPVYADRARAVADKVVDAVELLEQYSLPSITGRVAVHTPCSMQHGMKLVGRIEALLSNAGVTILPHKDGHLCCGSAGTYSILEPEISRQLRARKIDALTEAQPEVILTANIGCQLHLGEGSETPVMHWLEWLSADVD